MPLGDSGTTGKGLRANQELPKASRREAVKGAWTRGVGGGAAVKDRLKPQARGQELRLWVSLGDSEILPPLIWSSREPLHAQSPPSLMPHLLPFTQP